MTGISSLSQFLSSQTSQSNLGSSSALAANTAKTTATSSKTSEIATTTSDGDTITLSAAAQAILEKTNSEKKDYGFTLTEKQKEQLQSVLAQYKNKPQTQANYDAIQKDLKKYRLDTVNMGAKDGAKSFNMKSIMFSILGGKDVSNGTTERAQALAVKKSNYAQQIVADWAILRTASSTTTPTTA